MGAEETPPADSDSGSGKVTAEVAKWRTRLREVEQERDQLRERIDGMHRAQVESIAAAHLAVPADLLDLGAVTLCSPPLTVSWEGTAGGVEVGHVC